MKISELITLLKGEIVNLDEDLEIKSGYAGDFLSFVMGNAPKDSAWFTVMSNVNVIGVAALAKVAVVVVCEGVIPENEMIKAAKKNNINLIKTNLDIYSAVQVVGKLI